MAGCPYDGLVASCVPVMLVWMTACAELMLLPLPTRASSIDSPPTAALLICSRQVAAPEFVASQMDWGALQENNRCAPEEVG